MWVSTAERGVSPGRFIRPVVVQAVLGLCAFGCVVGLRRASWLHRRLLLSSNRIDGSGSFGVLVFALNVGVCLAVLRFQLRVGAVVVWLQDIVVSCGFQLEAEVPSGPVAKALGSERRMYDNLDPV